MALNKASLAQMLLAAEDAAAAAATAGGDPQTVRRNRAEAMAEAIDLFVRSGTVASNGVAAPGIAVTLVPAPATAAPGVVSTTGTIT